jgi:uncharacterized protein YceK
MKKILLVAALALGLSGCSTLIADFNAATTALSSPQTTQAIANLKAGAVAIACDTASISNLLASIAKQVGGTSHGNVVFTRDAESVYVASSTLCTAGGGIIAGMETIPSTSKPVALPSGT